MGFLLEFDAEFGGLRFWLIWLLGFDEDDDEKEVFFLGLFLFEIRCLKSSDFKLYEEFYFIF